MPTFRFKPVAVEGVANTSEVDVTSEGFVFHIKGGGEHTVPFATLGKQDGSELRTLLGKDGEARGVRYIGERDWCAEPPHIRLWSTPDITIRISRGLFDGVITAMAVTGHVTFDMA